MQHDDHVRKFGYIHASECRAAFYDELDRTRSYGFSQRLDRPIRVLTILDASKVFAEIVLNVRG